MPVPVALAEMNGSLRTGQKSAKMKEFVEQRLPSVSQQRQGRSSEVRFWDMMHNNNAPTIDNLYQVVKSSKEKRKTTILRADWKCPSTPYHCL